MQWVANNSFDLMLIDLALNISALTKMNLKSLRLNLKIDLAVKVMFDK